MSSAPRPHHFFFILNTKHKENNYKNKSLQENRNGKNKDLIVLDPVKGSKMKDKEEANDLLSRHLY